MRDPSVDSFSGNVVPTPRMRELAEHIGRDHAAKYDFTDGALVSEVSRYVAARTLAEADRSLAQIAGCVSGIGLA